MGAPEGQAEEAEEAVAGDEEEEVGRLGRPTGER
jgi:hypothetical protein